MTEPSQRPCPAVRLDSEWVAPLRTLSPLACSTDVKVLLMKLRQSGNRWASHGRTSPLIVGPDQGGALSLADGNCVGVDAHMFLTARLASGQTEVALMQVASGACLVATGALPEVEISAQMCPTLDHAHYGIGVRGSVLFCGVVGPTWRSTSGTCWLTLHYGWGDGAPVVPVEIQSVIQGFSRRPPQTHLLHHCCACGLVIVLCPGQLA